MKAAVQDGEGNEETVAVTLRVTRSRWSERHTIYKCNFADAFSTMVWHMSIRRLSASTK